MIKGSTMSSIFWLFETASEGDEVPQTVHHHNGCASAPRPKYLRALGMLRLVAEHCYPMAIRNWQDKRGLAAMTRKGAQ